jgi:cytoskeletal protein CcmA (bactofilin family)
MIVTVPKLPLKPLSQPVQRMGGLRASLLEIKKPTVISQSFEFEGHVRQGGSLSIEGRFKGSICCDQVYISQKAEVDADIECDELVVRGVFRGRAKCKELVVNSTATVDANIEYEVMRIGAGAMMGGDLVMRKG